MKVLVQGKGQVSLLDSNFVAQGGEGKVYVKGGRAYKIFHDPKTMIPEEKIRELSVLTKNTIIKPENLIYTTKNTLIGFMMQTVPQSIPLPRMFTSAYLNRKTLNNDTVTKLVTNIKDTISHVHDHDIIMVDGNELNYLIETRKHTTAYCIDVNSWQTPNYPATVIMPSIRDWHATEFTEISDWFSFAVIACQLFIGIHPYKGKNSHFKRATLEERMRANVSIFNPETRVPGAVRDFTNIPKSYYDWFKEVFENGYRSTPPDMKGQYIILPITPIITTHTGSKYFTIQQLNDYPGDIIDCTYFGRQYIIYTKKDVVIYNNNSYIKDTTSKVFSHSMSQKTFLVKTKDESLVYRSLEDSQSPYHSTNIKVEKTMIYENRLYGVNKDRFFEIDVLDTGSKPTFYILNTWEIFNNSTEMLDGVLCSSILGKTHLYLPYAPNKCAIVAIPELDKYKIIDAKCRDRVCMIIGQSGSKYDKFIIVFDENFKKYDIRILKDADNMLNFICLPNGLTISIHEDGALEMFRAKASSDVQVYKDSAIKSSMTLAHEGNIVRFYEMNRMYQLKMK